MCSGEQKYAFFPAWIRKLIQECFLPTLGRCGEYFSAPPAKYLASVAAVYF